MSVSSNYIIAVDIPCKQCGYNLRSLNSAGICPECQLAVATSVYQFLFSRIVQGWMQNVARGCDIVRKCCIYTVYSVLAVVVITGGMPVRSSAALPFKIANASIYVILPLFLGFIWLGWMVATSAKSAGKLSWQENLFRLTSRAMLTLHALIVLSNLYLNSTVFVLVDSYPFLRNRFVRLETFFFLAWINKLIYIRLRLRAFPDRDVKSRINNTFWFATILMTLSLAMADSRGIYCMTIMEWIEGLNSFSVTLFIITAIYYLTAITSMKELMLRQAHAEVRKNGASAIAATPPPASP